MMDIKQEELDKRFIDGVIAVESLVGQMKVLSRDEFNEFCKRVDDILKQEIGEERLDAIQGKGEIHT